MDEPTIIETLRQFAVREFPQQRAAIAGASEDSPLAPLGILDSLGLLTWVTFAEVRWEFKVAPADFKPEAFGSLRAIARLVERARAGRR
jgi:hypothetical protein